MPNRIIKESVCTSESISELSDFEFRLWVGLITQADDAGRGDARPAIIKGRVFPLRERVTSKDINAALHALAAHGCVNLYNVGGKPYYVFPSWAEHQRIRDCKPKYPGIDEADEEMPICGELPQVAASCGLNPIQSNTNPNPNPNPNPTRAGASDGDFDAFWKAYPKKVGKADAKKAFGKVKTPVSKLLEAIEQQKKSDQWTREGGRYIPNPATWLNQGRWDDELPEAKPDPNSIHGCSGIVTDEDRERIRRYMEEET